MSRGSSEKKDFSHSNYCSFLRRIRSLTCRTLLENNNKKRANKLIKENQQKYLIDRINDF